MAVFSSGSPCLTAAAPQNGYYGGTDALANSSDTYLALSNAVGA